MATETLTTIATKECSRGHVYHHGKRQCPECKKVSAAKYRAENKDKIKDGILLWAKNNPDKVKASNERYVNAHRAELNRKAAAYRLANPEKWKRTLFESKQRNKEKAKITRATHRLNNSERLKESAALWVKENPVKNRAKAARYRASKRLANVPWADRGKIDGMYLLAQQKTLLTGIEWVVDHMVPLKSKHVCGLHWEGNLQVITKTENQVKYNLAWPDM